MKIVTIEAWGLHLGYLGCYGNDWVGTPNLDRLAAEGIVFDSHIAEQPTLSPSTSTMHESPSGPTRLRIESMADFISQALPAIKRNAGWLWIEGPSLLPPWDLDDELIRGYLDEGDTEDGLAPWRDPPLDVVELTEAELLELQNTYAAVVTHFDAQLGALLDVLREKGVLDDMLLCVTASAGLPLGEHGMIGAPRPALHDELVHIPLVMRLPGGAHAGTRIAALTQPSDLAATLAQAAPPLPLYSGGEGSGVRGAAHAESDCSGEGRSAAYRGEGGLVPASQGRSLWPLIRGEVDTVRPYAVSRLRVGAYESRLLRSEDWAFHLPIAQPAGEIARPQMFAKPDDRWEVNDLIQQQSETAEAMAKVLAESPGTAVPGL